MSPRTLLLAAVVGVLLIGGATTGGTHASWVSRANLQTAGVSSATMGLGATASPTTLEVERGSTESTRVTVTDTSSTAARNLRQRATPTLTGSLPTGITASLTTATANGCTATAQGAVDLAPGGSFTTCVTVSASASTTATSATVRLSYSGAQVRGTTVAGWTTAAQTVTVPVTIVVTEPVLDCSPGNANGQGSYTFSWSAITGATAYRFYRATTQNGTYSLAGTVPGSQTQVSTTLDRGESGFVRVTAVVGGTESARSNAIRLQRGNGAPTCTEYAS
ncbi:hypothetical protein IEZ26_06135 [Nocardioides cavernae]|uniref:Fibronectin type-III domain-containing protein n=1 Tax=Nocardioides cavernae TaxID=1921566 RepID=A0ABR8N7S6_9ACTN|nr:hypothetical protein [Nocardioides cavernae]MBD3924193.1 hypothetical protein [Nocardioides cavernae]MBM7510869.1 hypothetical protein [Nocardioides cavernae]